MSLLHLAAFLGYTRLVSALLTWRSENPNVILDTEIDALSQDNDGFTPLVNSYLKHISIMTVKYSFEIFLFFLKNIQRCGRVLKVIQILQ